LQPQERGLQCAVKHWKKNNAKSMTVANGGNAIEDRRSVGLGEGGDFHHKC